MGIVNDNEDGQKETLLKAVRALMNKITPTSLDALTKEFLSYDIPNSPALKEVIGIMFDRAVEEPKICPLVAEMCAEQVREEQRKIKAGSIFRDCILTRALLTFIKKTHDEIFSAEVRQATAEEYEPKKEAEMEIELGELSMAKFRKRKFGNIIFIGELYKQKIIVGRIIHFCYGDLLGKIVCTGSVVDEESVECAVTLLGNIGEYLEKDVGPNSQLTTQIVNSFYDELDKIDEEGSVSLRIRSMIKNLLELRKNQWKKGCQSIVNTDHEKDVAMEKMQIRIDSLEQSNVNLQAGMEEMRAGITSLEQSNASLQSQVEELTKSVTGLKFILMKK